MKLLEIVGFSRSGLHAVINWFLKNLTNYEGTFNWKLDLTNGKGIIYINEANLDIPMTLKYINDQAPTAKFIIMCYENVNPHFTLLNNERIHSSLYSSDLPSLSNLNFHYRLHTIRNFYDNLASRIKANNKLLFKDRDGNPFLFDVGENFLNLWKQQAKFILEKKSHTLKFEDWCTNKEKRNELLKDITGQLELYDTNVKGTESSFDSNSDIFNRKKLIDFDAPILELIRKDNELHYLLGRLGYEYIEL